MKYFFFVALLITLFECNAQNITKVYSEADNAYKSGNFSEAIYLFNEIVERNENLPHVYFNLANAYRLNLQYKEAIATYIKVIATSPNKFPESYFWLAELQKMCGNPQEAYDNYITFLSYQSSDSLKNEKANNEILYKNYKFQTQDSITIRKDSISPFIHSYGVVKCQNTYIYSGIPLLGDSVSGAATFFVYVKNGVENPFTYFIAKETRFMTDFCVTPQKDSMLLTLRKTIDGNSWAEVHYVNKRGAIWSKPIRVKEPLNIKNTNTIHPYICDIDLHNYILFSSDRAGGYGGMDIWMCEILSNRKLSSPVNLGAKINTSGDEICPFYDTLEQTLYFSSNQHFSLGGFDIFSSKRINNTWNTIENIGMPINSTYNDYYFRIIDSTVYFVSNRELTKLDTISYNYNKVYTYQLPQKNIGTTKIEETVFVNEKTLLQQAQGITKIVIPTISLYFDHNKPEQGENIVYQEDYENYLKSKNAYILTISGNKNTDEEKKINDFFENEVIINYNKTHDFINQINQLIMQGDTVVVQLEAYTSKVGSYDYNVKLAERRVESVRNFLFMQFDERQKNFIIFEVLPPHISASEIPKNASEFNLEYALDRKIIISFKKK